MGAGRIERARYAARAAARADSERLDLTRDTSLHRAELLLCEGLEAAALMQSGDAKGAARIAARRLEDLEDSICTTGIVMYSVCAVADVFLALAEFGAMPIAVRPGTALLSARAACRVVWRYAAKTRICRARAELLAARLALLQGRQRRAARQLGRALANAKRLGMPLEQAMCHLALARLQNTDAAKRMHAGRGSDVMRDSGCRSLVL